MAIYLQKGHLFINMLARSRRRVLVTDNLRFFRNQILLSCVNGSLLTAKLLVLLESDSQWIKCVLIDIILSDYIFLFLTGLQGIKFTLVKTFLFLRSFVTLLSFLFSTRSNFFLRDWNFIWFGLFLSILAFFAVDKHLFSFSGLFYGLNFWSYSFLVFFW